jgi:hypothetical protein
LTVSIEETPSSTFEASLSFGQLLVRATKAFGVNFLLLIGLHWLVPVALVVPLATGYVSGWNARATPFQGAIIGFIMGLWMFFICGIVTGVFVVASLTFPGGLMPGAELGIGLIVGFLVLHISIFGGTGAMLGGYFRRRERSEAEIG